MRKLTVISVLFLFVLTYLSYALLPVYVPKRTLEIPYGTPTLRIFEVLQEEGIVRTRISLLMIHAFRKSKLEAGEYEFEGYVTPFEVYEKLSKGIHKLHRIVVKEGSDLYDIGEILEKEGVCKKEDFLRFATDERVPKGYGLSTPTMEGFLFPDTYLFSKNTHPLRVIEVMYKNFLEKTLPIREEASRRGIPLEELVTVASMVEKETFWDEERRLVAAVIYNRLRMRMKLQIDPTVIYALKRKNLWKGSLSKRDLSFDDPYNTYLYFGLPPTPICNPGLPSLWAALNPARINHLYFVLDPETGRHNFSSNYLNHVENVNKLRRFGR